MKSEIDWIGKWFELQEESGESAQISFCHVKEGQEQPEWISMSHIVQDGIGALTQILEKNGNALRQPASGYAALDVVPVSGFDPALIDLATQPSPRWSSQDGNWKPTPGVPCAPSTRAWRILTEEKGQAIENRAGELNVSFNSHCLSAIHRIVANYLAPDSNPAIWQLPVNLRGAVKLSLASANQFCAMDLALEEGATAAQTEEAFFSAVVEDRPWYYWKLNNIGRQMGNEQQGLAVMRELLEWRMESEIFRVGLFSNVGVWKSIGSPQPEQGYFAAMAPVTFLCPFSFTMLTTQKRLGLALQAHCSLGLAESEVDSMLDDFISVALSSQQE